MKNYNEKRLNQLKQLEIEKHQQAKIKGGNAPTIIIEDMIDF